MTATTQARPGRNEPCHCGSGRKYKQCCLPKDEAAAAAARAKAAADAVALSAEAGASEAGASDGGTEAAAAVPAPPSRHQTHQPWKGTTSRGFVPRSRAPRKVGGS